MKNKFFPSLIIWIMFFSVVVMPLYVSAQSGLQSDKSGIIPCGNAVGSDGKVVNPCGFDDLLALGFNLVNFLILLSIPLTAIAFAWAGFLYLTSAGSQSKVEKAKEIFWKVLWGFIFILTAWLIVYMITKFLATGFSLLKPGS